MADSFFKSLFFDSREDYLKNTHEIIKKLDENKHTTLALLFAMIFQDFGDLFLLPFLSLRGIGNSLRSYNLNPKNLDKFSPTSSPTLFIHGHAHNHGIWITVISKLQQKLENPGPFFTVNYPAGCSVSQGVKIVSKRIEEIRALYYKHQLTPPPLNLVGYSNGGDLEVQYLIHHPETVRRINKIITIAFPIPLKEKQILDKMKFTQIYDIVAEYDGIVTRQSILPNEHKFIIKTSHLGIMKSPQMEKTLTKILMNS